MGSDKHERDFEHIEAWFERDKLERSRMGPMFVKLLRILTEAEVPEVWNPAIELTCRFLDVAMMSRQQERQYT